MKYNDRAILDNEKEKDFALSCHKEFSDTSVVKSNMRKVSLYSALSYFPNIISWVTAGFGVFYILSSYEFHVQVILGGLLAIVAGGLELAKRGLINVTARDFFLKKAVSPFMPIAIAVLILISMTVSFFGGDKLVHATANPPEMAINPEIATIRQQIEDKRNTIAGLRKTTWKGKITRDAVKGINANEAVINSLLARIDKLENQDMEAYSPIKQEFDSKIINFGFVLGGIAVIADVALLYMLWTIKRLKYEVLLLVKGKGFKGELERLDEAEQFVAQAQQFVNTSAVHYPNHNGKVNGNKTTNKNNAELTPETSSSTVVATKNVTRPIGFTVDKSTKEIIPDQQQEFKWPPVATGGHCLESTTEEEIEQQKKNVFERTLKDADSIDLQTLYESLKYAESTVLKWKAKERNRQGKSETNQKHIRKWTNRVAWIKEQIKQLEDKL